MSQIQIPQRFSKALGVSSGVLLKYGLFDPSLNSDSELFVDPLLLSKCKFKEISVQGTVKYNDFFSNLFLLLSQAATADKSDQFWNEAFKRFDGSEILKEYQICLGYGNESVDGRGWGKKKKERLLRNAKSLIDKGVKDTRLFNLVGLFQDKVGPDLISDLTIKILKHELSEITQSFCIKNKVRTSDIMIDKVKYKLPISPINDKPILLIPIDLLRDLPVNKDIVENAKFNNDLRARTNSHIADIFSKAAKEKDKKKALDLILSSPSQAVENMIISLMMIDPFSYDIAADRKGEILKTRIGEIVEALGSLPVVTPTKNLDKDVRSIIQSFANVVQYQGWNKYLWKTKDKPHNEDISQGLFRGLSSELCKRSKLGFAPEADAGTGPVDFKFMSGSDNIVVEVKLDRNSHVKDCYAGQLQAYIQSNGSTKGYLVIIRLNTTDKKFNEILSDIKQIALDNGVPYDPSHVIVIDGRIKPSPSKIRLKAST